MPNPNPRTPLPDIDRAAFASELGALRRELVANIGPDDAEHLLRMERWGRVCSVAGYATAWIVPNPISVLLMGMGNVARWTMVTHHVMHRGYDKAPVPARLTSCRYAKGWRRWLDWPDWMDPGAWAYEHNQLHHFHTGEVDDPDLVEHNAWLLRLRALPRPLKWLMVLLLMLTWKLSYYAPNTLWTLQQRDLRKASDAELPTPGNVRRLMYPGERLLLPVTRRGLAFWWRCVLPNAVLKFGVLPALFLPLGTWAWAAVLINSLLAELYANAHAFLIIVPNHAGDDLWRFDDQTTDRGEFYLRQIVGSVNYPGGRDLPDFLQGYLNYQIEHHLWPDLPMLKYRQAAPQVKALCQRYGVPYVEENVFKRFAKLWAILMGDASMRRAEALSEKCVAVSESRAL